MIKARLAVVLLLLGLALVGVGNALDQQQRPFLYLALGASDALGFGALPLTRGYVYQVAAGLGESYGIVYLVNPAIPGGLIEDIHIGLDLALRGVVAPELVTVWVGANDLIADMDPADFEVELQNLLQRLRRETTAALFIADLPDLTRIPRFRQEPVDTVTAERVAAFNAAINRQAQAYDVPLVQLSVIHLDDELTSDADGFHPSNQGHGVIARAFLDKIPVR